MEAPDSPRRGEHHAPSESERRGPSEYHRRGSHDYEPSDSHETAPRGGGGGSGGSNARRCDDYDRETRHERSNRRPLSDDEDDVEFQRSAKRRREDYDSRDDRGRSPSYRRGYSPRRYSRGPPPRDYDRDRRDRRHDDNHGGRRERRPERKDRSPPPRRDPPEPRPAPMTEEERRRKEIEEARREDMTVLVINLALKASEKDVWSFFTRNAGKVRDIQLIKDARSGKSKGIAYVEFHDAESVLKSLNLTGQSIGGTAIRVLASQGEKNRAAKAAKQQQAELAAQGPTRLFVGNLVDNLSHISSAELRELFGPFGTITGIDIPKDPYTGGGRGYAFVQFKTSQEARDAMQAMHCFEIGGKQLRVGFAGQDSKQNAQQGVGAVDGSASGVDLDRIADDHDDRLLHGGAVMRLALSQKLQQKSSDQIPLFPGAQVPPQLQIPTSYLCLSNMFTRQEALESGPELLDEVKEDVMSECKKYGEVQELFVSEQRLDGRVYVAFAEVSGAIEAQKALHGRSYGGTAVAATFIDEQSFQSSVNEN